MLSTEGEPRTHSKQKMNRNLSKVVTQNPSRITENRRVDWRFIRALALRLCLSLLNPDSLHGLCVWALMADMTMGVWC